MLFDSNISVAVRCMDCGSFHIQDITLFDLHKSEMHHMSCDCGKYMIRLKSKGCKTFHVYIPCEICNKEHLFTFTSKQVLTKKMKILECPASRAELAFIGNKQLVEEVVTKYENDIKELIDVLI